MHLVVGVVAVGVGVAVLMNQAWAMVTGIVMATLSLILQFLFIPWQPIWALVIIGINIAVIWALATDSASADGATDPRSRSTPRRHGRGVRGRPG